MNAGNPRGVGAGHVNDNDNDNDDDDEGFSYPVEEGEGHEQEEEEVIREVKQVDDEAPEDSDDEEFRYPGDSPTQKHDPISAELQREPSPIEESGPPVQESRVVRPTSAQLEALYAAALSGDINMLRNLINNATASGEMEAFALVNDASPRTGLTVVHAAASRGQLEALKWRT